LCNGGVTGGVTGIVASVVTGAVSSSFETAGATSGADETFAVCAESSSDKGTGVSFLPLVAASELAFFAGKAFGSDFIASFAFLSAFAFAAGLSGALAATASFSSEDGVKLSAGRSACGSC
jgi:hypothetical protein